MISSFDKESRKPFSSLSISLDRYLRIGSFGRWADCMDLHGFVLASRQSQHSPLPPACVPLCACFLCASSQERAALAEPVCFETQAMTLVPFAEPRFQLLLQLASSAPSQPKYRTLLDQTEQTCSFGRRSSEPLRRWLTTK